MICKHANGCLPYRCTSAVFPRKATGEAWTSAKYQLPSGFGTTKPHSNKLPRTPQRLRINSSFFQWMPWTAYATLLTSEYITKKRRLFENNFSLLTLMEDLREKRIEELCENDACSWVTAKCCWILVCKTLYFDGNTGRAMRNSVVAAATKETPLQAGLRWNTYFKVQI